jgi:hypothetical protein
MRLIQERSKESFSQRHFRKSFHTASEDLDNKDKLPNRNRKKVEWFGSKSRGYNQEQ